MATTLPAISMFNDDPFDIGIMGTFSTAAAADLLARCDVLPVVGATLNKLTTFGNTL